MNSLRLRRRWAGVNCHVCPAVCLLARWEGGNFLYLIRTKCVCLWTSVCGHCPYSVGCVMLPWTVASIWECSSVRFWNCQQSGRKPNQRAVTPTATLVLYSADCSMPSSVASSAGLQMESNKNSCVEETAEQPDQSTVHWSAKSDHM